MAYPDEEHWNPKKQKTMKYTNPGPTDPRFYWRCPNPKCLSLDHDELTVKWFHLTTEKCTKCWKEKI